MKAAARHTAPHVALVALRRTRGGWLAEVIDYGRVLERHENHAAIADALIQGRAFTQRDLARIELAYPAHVAEARSRALRLHAAATPCMTSETLALAFRDELDTVLSLTGTSAGTFSVAV